MLPDAAADPERQKHAKVPRVSSLIQPVCRQSVRIDLSVLPTGQVEDVVKYQRKCPRHRGLMRYQWKIEPWNYD